VQEAVHGAVRDLRGEHCLLLGVASNDEHQLRELRVYAIDELTHRAGDRSAVDHRDSALMGQERAREVDLGADRQNRVRGVRDLLQRHDQTRIAREGDQRLWREPQAQPGDTEWRRRPKVSRWDLGGHDCHNPENPPVRAARALPRG